MLCCCKFQFRHVEPTFNACGVFFCAINPAKRCQTIRFYHASTLFSRKFEIDNPDFSPVWNKLGKVEAISVLGIPPLGMPKTLGIWEWGCPKRGDAHITVTPVTAGRREPWDRGWFMISFSIQEIFLIFFIFIYFIYLFFREKLKYRGNAGL